MGVETDERVVAPELLVEADWGGVYIGTFSITHNGLLRVKRFFNDATCDAVLVPTNFANSLFNFHPTFVTASLKRSASICSRPSSSSHFVTGRFPEYSTLLGNRLICTIYSGTLKWLMPRRALH